MLASFVGSTHAHLILAPESCATTSGASASVVTLCSIGVNISDDEITSQGGPFSAGAFFTLYDAAPFAGNPVAMPTTGLLTFRWGVFSELVDTPAVGTSPFDDPAIANVRFLCGNCGDWSGQDLGTFTISFAGTFDTRVLTYDSLAFDRTSRAPVATLATLRLTAVPEAATLALAMLALLLVVAQRSNARRDSSLAGPPH